MLKFEVSLEEEQVRESFESVEVKYSKKKVKQLIEQYDLETNVDLMEMLERTVMDFLEEIITDEFE